MLREGTENSQGKSQLISNITACQAIVDAVRTTLGPRGMDKLMVDTQGMQLLSINTIFIISVHSANLRNLSKR